MVWEKGFKEVQLNFPWLLLTLHTPLAIATTPPDTISALEAFLFNKLRWREVAGSAYPGLDHLPLDMIFPLIKWVTGGIIYKAK